VRLEEISVVKSEKEIMALSQEELLAKDNIKFDNEVRLTDLIR